MALIDFTLSNARRFYLSMENPSGVKEFNKIIICERQTLSKKSLKGKSCNGLSRCQTYDLALTCSNALRYQRLVITFSKIL